MDYDDVVNEILKFVENIKDIYAFTSTSQRLYTLYNYKHFWHFKINLLHSNFPGNTDIIHLRNIYNLLQCRKWDILITSYPILNYWMINNKKYKLDIIANLIPIMAFIPGYDLLSTSKYILMHIEIIKTCPNLKNKIIVKLSHQNWYPIISLILELLK